MTLQLKVSSIVCSGCVDKIVAAVQGIDSAATVTGDLETKVMTVETSADEEAVKAAITDAGHLVE
ncbi:MAG: heavy-metal-associated domain-containing protein [Cyanophyceae cyanobacterium]